MFQDMTIKELLAHKQDLTLIDVRSPSEYKEATIPGSINIPIFTDEERAEVGTLYKQESQQAAKDRGLEIISAKLPSFVDQFQQIDQQKVVFCWRGGMRSKTAATVVDLMGIAIHRLEGGIRSYRNLVVDTFASYQIKPASYALNGYTGSGKTIILNRLAHQGYPVIDLEGIAGHRGSIFGQIGLEPSNQRKFDSLLFEELRRVQDAPYVLLEAESRRIGKVVLPDFLLKKKEQGLQIFIDMPMAERVRNILEDYQPWNNKQEFIRAFKLIKKRIHTPVATEIEQNLEAEDYSLAVRLLLEYYYDPRYQYAIDQYPKERTYSLQVNNVDEAVDSIKSLLTSITVK